MNDQGFGVGSCLTLNSGCMTHGTIGSKTSGLSKALTMAVCLLVCPLDIKDDMNFTNAWYAANIANLPRRGLEILWFLDRAVTKYFWVSMVRDGYWG